MKIPDILRTLKTLATGKFKQLRPFLTDDGDKIVDKYVDGNETEWRLFPVEIKGKDTSKNTISKVGGSRKITIDKDSEEWIEPFEIEIYRVISDITKNHLLIVECVGPKEVTP